MSVDYEKAVGRLSVYGDRFVDRFRKSKFAQVAAVFLISISIRAYLFELVGIWGDLGFYVYNSRLMLQGQTPFIDFLARSPSFMYAYTWFRSVIGMPVVGLRIFINIWWVLTAGFVYLIARQMDGHVTGVVAVAMTLITPFALVWGMWANTMGMAAFFGIAGVWVALNRDGVLWWCVIGGLLAIAYLARRSIIVVFFALGLWLVIRWLRSRRTFGNIVIRGSVMVVSFAAVVYTVYLLIASGRVHIANEIATIHTLGLFLSHGRGGFPIVGQSAPIVTNEIKNGRIPIFNDLCQMCGMWTARTFAKTTLATLPLAGLGWWYYRDITDKHYSRPLKLYFFGFMLILAGVASARAVLAGYHLRVLAVVALALFAIVAYRTPKIAQSQLYSREAKLILVVLFGLTAGYLYRNRMLHTYYFMDFWPYVSILGGMIIHRGWKNARSILRYLLIIAMILSLLTATVGAHPLANVAFQDNEDKWFTVNNIRDSGQYLEDHIDDGRVVLATSPGYVAGSDAPLLNDNARIYLVAIRYKSEGPGADVYRDTIAGLRSGHIQFVVLDYQASKFLYEWNATTQAVFMANYCRVDTENNIFGQTGADLYRYQPDCPKHREPTGRVKHNPQY